MKKNSKRKFAFTLAEVLITLSIIGIVAALTLPTVMSSHRKKIVETRLVKFYSVMNQAVQMAEVDFGDKQIWGNIGAGYELDEEGNPDKSKSIPYAWFEKYMHPYLKVDKVSVLKDGTVFVTFPDGSAAVFNRNSILFYPDANKFKVYVDTEDSYSLNSVEDSGKYYFTFAFWPYKKENPWHYNRGVEPYAATAWDGDINVLRNHSMLGCKENPTLERAYCTKLIQLNGWKIPENYPVKF